MGILNKLGEEAGEALNRAVRRRHFAYAEAIGLDMTGENAAAMDRGDLRVWLDSPHEALFADQSEEAKAARRLWMQPRVSVFDQPPGPFVLSKAAQAAVGPFGDGQQGGITFESLILAGRQWLDSFDPDASGVLVCLGPADLPVLDDPRFIASQAAGEIVHRGGREWAFSRALVLRGAGDQP